MGWQRIRRIPEVLTMFEQQRDKFGCDSTADKLSLRFSARFRMLHMISILHRYNFACRPGTFARVLCLAAMVLFLHQNPASLLPQGSRSTSTPSIAQLQCPTVGLDQQQTKQSQGNPLQANLFSSSNDFASSGGLRAGEALAPLFSSPPLSSFLVFTQTTASYL